MTEKFSTIGDIARGYPSGFRLEGNNSNAGSVFALPNIPYDPDKSKKDA